MLYMRNQLSIRSSRMSLRVINFKNNKDQNVSTGNKDFITDLNNGAANTLPDFNRMVRMQYWTDLYEPPGFNFNPATIYKINVPGYFYCESSWLAWSDETDTTLCVAEHPAYLYANEYTVSGAGDNIICCNYEKLRCKLYSWISDPHSDIKPAPITPGTSTYVRFCDGTSHPHWLTWYFVPCANVSQQIKPTDYFTRVGRGRNLLAWEVYGTDDHTTVAGRLSELRHGIFNGSWLDNFNSDYTLDQNKVIYLDGQYLVGGTGCGDSKSVVLTHDNYKDYIGREYWPHYDENGNALAPYTLEQSATMNVTAYDNRTHRLIQTITPQGTFNTYSGYPTLDEEFALSKIGVYKNTQYKLNGDEVTVQLRYSGATCSAGESWADGAVFVLIDPLKTGYEREWYLAGNTLHEVLRYFSDAEIDDFISRTSEADLDSAVANSEFDYTDPAGKTHHWVTCTVRTLLDRMRNRWCIVTHYWRSSTNGKELANNVWFVSKEESVNPPTKQDTSLYCSYTQVNSNEDFQLVYETVPHIFAIRESTVWYYGGQIQDPRNYLSLTLCKPTELSNWHPPV